ncbi:MAG: rod shape-determining protein RodA, partial [Syntrophobacteraceae bacterium CG07_land_8_20_14_0_80_61_8]
MVDRRLIENFDWWILLVFFAIILVGLVALYSALYQQIQASATNNLFIRQVAWLLMGLVCFVGFLMIDYQKLKHFSLWSYLAVVLLLLLVPVVGTEVNGAKRWLSLAGVRFQPSEFMKLIIVLHLANYFSSHEIKTYPRLKEFVVPVLLTAIPVLLILLEPDLGTALMVLIAAMTLIYFIGIRLKFVLILLIVTLPMIWPVWNYALKPYQKERILILLSPERDPLGAGYHIRQSKIAIGSGKLWGKGFLNGTQTKLRFLPEKHTDFIFSVLAEEWGFLGCGLLLSLFAALVYLAFRVARRSKDRFGALLVIGMTGLILWQMVINIGMVLGMMPVVG